MIKELYRFETVETALNVTQGIVDSVRKKQIVKSGCRVYENGCIGIAGTLGEVTRETWDRAVESLSRQVPYPHTPQTNLRRHEDRTGEVLDPAVFTRRAEQLLDRLREAFPRIIFSNQISMRQYTVSLTNDAGLDLLHRENYYAVVLLAKDVDSTAVFDTAAQYLDRSFDVDAVFEDVSQILQAHTTEAAMPENARLPLIVEPSLFMEPLDQALNGQLYGRGASLLSGKQGQTLFSEEFTLYVDRSPEEFAGCFFDAEGMVLPGDKLPLIEQGILRRPYADKKTAADFSCYGV